MVKSTRKGKDEEVKDVSKGPAEVAIKDPMLKKPAEVAIKDPMLKKPADKAIKDPMMKKK